jgi:hypothetical protein
MSRDDRELVYLGSLMVAEEQITTKAAAALPG